MIFYFFCYSRKNFLLLIKSPLFANKKKKTDRNIKKKINNF